MYVYSVQVDDDLMPPGQMANAWFFLRFGNGATDCMSGPGDS